MPGVHFNAIHLEDTSNLRDNGLVGCFDPVHPGHVVNVVHCQLSDVQNVFILEHRLYVDAVGFQNTLAFVFYDKGFL